MNERNSNSNSNNSNSKNKKKNNPKDNDNMTMRIKTQPSKHDQIILSFFLKSKGENRFVKSVNFLPANIQSMNPMQKYPHVIESFACTRKCLLLCFYSQ